MIHDSLLIARLKQEAIDLLFVDRHSQHPAVRAAALANTTTALVVLDLLEIVLINSCFRRPGASGKTLEMCGCND